jgi:hypothetical protein
MLAAPYERLGPRGVPPEDLVLRHVEAGSAVVLNLTPEQRHALSDHEGQRALSLLCHLLLARHAADQPDELPLTEQFILRLACRLRIPLGRNAARRVIARLKATGVIVPLGSYRQAYGINPGAYKVTLWIVTPIAWVGTRPRSFAGPRKRPRSATRTASVATPGQHKLDPWWQHPLFGNPDGRPPPGTKPKRLERWASQPHLAHEQRREREHEKATAATATSSTGATTKSTPFTQEGT